MGAILNNIPAEAQITRIEYEGPRIALYTKNPAFLHKNSYVISEIVNSLKKRVVTRTEKSIRKPESEASPSERALLGAWGFPLRGHTTARPPQTAASQQYQRLAHDHRRPPQGTTAPTAAFLVGTMG